MGRLPFMCMHPPPPPPIFRSRPELDKYWEVIMT